jgi:DNA repair protein RadC
VNGRAEENFPLSFKGGAQRQCRNGTSGHRAKVRRVSDMKIKELFAQYRQTEIEMDGRKVCDAGEALKIGRAIVQEYHRENFVALFLDVKNRVIAARVMFQGGAAGCSVYVQEVIKYALLCNAQGIIILHNHPSGDVTPSGPDVKLTVDLFKAAKLMEISLHDHIIIDGDATKWYSFSDAGNMAEIRKGESF